MARTRRPVARNRQHGPILGPPPRRALERAGWRTTLEFHENHVRSLDGRLLEVVEVWVAEAELHGDNLIATAQAEAGTRDEAWSALLDRVETGRVTRYRRPSADRRADSA